MRKYRSNYYMLNMQESVRTALDETNLFTSARNHWEFLSIMTLKFIQRLQLSGIFTLLQSSFLNNIGYIVWIKECLLRLIK